MHPLLFEIGALRVTSYGVALVLAFALGIAVAARRAGRDGIPPDRIVDAGLVVLITSLLGSRLLWIATHPAAVAADGGWLPALLPWRGADYGLVGLSMQGGVVLAALAAGLHLRWRRVPLRRALDAMAPSVSLGEGITRIGCFLNGCCHGVVCEAPIGVRFPADSQAAQLFGDVAVHPTQLYASLGGFAIFALLSWALPRRRFPGAIVCAWALLFSLQRLVVDLFRYYESSVVLLRVGELAITVNTVAALLLAAAGAAGYARLSASTPKRSQ